MLKGKLTAFAAVIIIMWGGGGIRNIQSQSKIPEAGGRTASEPVSPPLYFAAHPIHTEVPSDHPQIVPIAYPHLNPYFCSHGIFFSCLLFLNQIGACYSPHEKHLPCPYCCQIDICPLLASTQGPFCKRPNVFDFKFQLKCQVSCAYKKSFTPVQYSLLHPMLIVGLTLSYCRQIHICWLVFLSSTL